MINWVRTWDGYRGKLGEVVLFWIVNNQDTRISWCKLHTMLPDCQKQTDCNSVAQAIERADRYLEEWFRLTGTGVK